MRERANFTPAMGTAAGFDATATTPTRPSTYIEKGVGSAYLDIIIGNDGENELLGNGGDDRIDGGNGDDRLTGGLGADWLQGGRGRDTFVFNHADDSQTSNHDRIAASVVLKETGSTCTRWMLIRTRMAFRVFASSARTSSARHTENCERSRTPASTVIAHGWRLASGKILLW